MKSDVSRTNGATPLTGGALLAPKLSDQLENALSMMNISADLVESLRQLPQDKREQVEREMPLMLEGSLLCAVNHFQGKTVDYAAIRAKYPPIVAESLIIGYEKVKGGTDHAS